MGEKERNVERIERAVYDFGGLVRDFRLKNNLSLLDWSEIVGYSSSYCWRIENDKRNPDMDTRVVFLTKGMCWSTEDIYGYLEGVISRKILEKE